MSILIGRFSYVHISLVNLINYDVGNPNQTRFQSTQENTWKDSTCNADDPLPDDHLRRAIYILLTNSAE